MRDGVVGFRLASSQEFDAILLDVNLPRMDGLALCKKLRGEAHVDIPILMLTARDTLRDKLAGFEGGFLLAAAARRYRPASRSIAPSAISASLARPNVPWAAADRFQRFHCHRSPSSRRMS